MFWKGPVLDSKAVWIHVASLKLGSLELSEFLKAGPLPSISEGYLQLT